jgi:hypothetical protein
MSCDMLGKCDGPGLGVVVTPSGNDVRNGTPLFSVKPVASSDSDNPDNHDDPNDPDSRDSPMICTLCASDRGVVQCYKWKYPCSLSWYRCKDCVSNDAGFCDVCYLLTTHRHGKKCKGCVLTPS